MGGPDAVAAHSRHGPGAQPGQAGRIAASDDCLCGYLTLAEALYGNPRPFASNWNFGPPDEHAQPVARLTRHRGVRALPPPCGRGIRPTDIERSARCGKCGAKGEPAASELGWPFPTTKRSTDPISLPIAPNSSAPASELITPPSNALTTARPSTVPNSNECCLHYVAIGEAHRLAHTRSSKATLPRCAQFA